MAKVDPLITYLATHDAPCPGCYKNIRGHTESRCLACGRVLRLGEVQTAHDVFGNATGTPVIAQSQAHQLTLEEYLAKYDAPCPNCAYNLRGLSDDTCPECGCTICLSDLLPEQPGPGGAQHSTYPIFVSIAIPVIAIAFLPVIVHAFRSIWDFIILNDKADLVISAAIACSIGLGVVYAIRQDRATKSSARVITRASMERIQNFKIGTLLIVFAVAIVLIGRMLLRFLGGIMGGAW